MGDLLTNETIVKLLDDELTTETAGKLAYTQVFPCEYVPETAERGYTYICFDVDIQGSVNKTYLSPVLYVWVFAHRSKLRLPEGGVITDKLCSEICKMINGSLDYGLGHLSLYSVKRFAPMTDYQGKCLTFNATDFSRQYDGTRKIPSNRKRG